MSFKVKLSRASHTLLSREKDDPQVAGINEAHSARASAPDGA